MVGQYRSLEIPNLNTVYEDEYCTVFIHDIEGKGELLVIHVDVVKTVNRKILNHYFDVIESVFEALRARGIKEVEAWVSTDEEMRFAIFYGFTEQLGQLTVNGRETLPEVYRLRKEL